MVTERCNDREIRLKPTWEWQACWASYWFGDREVFDFTVEDFDQRAAALAQAGINAVITFGGFHFRWSYVDEWPRLLRTLRHICESCHRHGIKVVEHHSAVLTHNPLGVDEHRSVVANYRRSAYPVDMCRHPGVMRQMEMGDASYQGCRFSSMRQIDPRTGQFSRTNYRGWVFCYNNPDWQRLYFHHLKDIYACGVDGIMTDDIQFWPAHYGCGCLHCREKFRAETGCDMPAMGDPGEGFYNHAENAVWRRWVLWRIDCHRQHQQRVLQHAKCCGAEVMRPIYTSSNTNSLGARGMGSALDDLAGLYSTVFTEVNKTDLQAHCWLRIGAESSQRRALAARNQVPPMCLFYPNTPSENLFCWAMTKAWGQRYWGTNSLLDHDTETAMLRQTFQFEQKHAAYYEQIESPAEVGVLFSARSVWLHQDADLPPDYIRMSDPASTDCWAGWCEVLALGNIPYDTLLEEDLEDRRYFDRLRLIIVPNAVCMSDRQIRALKSFVRNGGTAVITHKSGMRTERGRWRKKHPFTELIGADYVDVMQHSPAWLPVDDLPVKARACRKVHAPTALFKLYAGVEVWMKLADGSGPAVFSHRYGKGTVVTFAGKPGRLVCVNRHLRSAKNGKQQARIDFHQDPAVTALMEKSVRYLLGDTPVLTVSGAPRGCVVTAFEQAGRMLVHVVNAAGTLADSGKTMMLPVPLKFPRLDRLPGGAPSITIKVRHPGTQARLISPEFDGSLTLDCTRQNDYATIKLPVRDINCCGLILLDS